MILFDAFLAKYSWWRYWRGGVWARWANELGEWHSLPTEYLREESINEMVNMGHLQLEIHV